MKLISIKAGFSCMACGRIFPAVELMTQVVGSDADADADDTGPIYICCTCERLLDFDRDMFWDYYEDRYSLSCVSETVNDYGLASPEDLFLYLKAKQDGLNSIQNPFAFRILPEFFDEFLAGKKTQEFRRNEKKYNFKTCLPGRQYIFFERGGEYRIAHAYSSGMNRCHFNDLESKTKNDLKKAYGLITKDKFFVFIQIEKFKIINIGQLSSLLDEKLLILDKK